MTEIMKKTICIIVVLAMIVFSFMQPVHEAEASAQALVVGAGLLVSLLAILIIAADLTSSNLEAHRLAQQIVQMGDFKIYTEQISDTEMYVKGTNPKTGDLWARAKLRFVEVTGDNNNPNQPPTPEQVTGALMGMTFLVFADRIATYLQQKLWTAQEKLINSIKTYWDNQLTTARISNILVRHGYYVPDGDMIGSLWCSDNFGPEYVKLEYPEAYKIIVENLYKDYATELLSGIDYDPMFIRFSKAETQHEVVFNTPYFNFETDVEPYVTNFELDTTTSGPAIYYINLFQNHNYDLLTEDITVIRNAKIYIGDDVFHWDIGPNYRDWGLFKNNEFQYYDDYRPVPNIRAIIYIGGEESDIFPYSGYYWWHWNGYNSGQLQYITHEIFSDVEIVAFEPMPYFDQAKWYQEYYGNNQNFIHDPEPEEIGDIPFVKASPLIRQCPNCGHKFQIHVDSNGVPLADTAPCPNCGTHVLTDPERKPILVPKPGLPFDPTSPYLPGPGQGPAPLPPPAINPNPLPQPELNPDPDPNNPPNPNPWVPSSFQMFPFCLPWDVLDFIKMWNSPPSLPNFTIDLFSPLRSNYSINIEPWVFNMYDIRYPIIVFRTFIFLFGAFGIIRLTQKVVWK